MTLRCRAAVALVALLSGCGAGSTRARTAAPEPVRLTLLYTSDEHGWVAPVHAAGKPKRGGAAALLARWRDHEGHCVPDDGPCDGASTIALSGGDNWTGPAISTFFKGEIAALAMRRLGYSAIALGNHELDFGRAIFARNAAAQRIPYLAANVTPRASAGGVAEPFTIVRRKGVQVGVVGLSTKKAPSAGIRTNYDGLDYGDEEPAMVRAVDQAYAAGADVVVVISHVCAEELAPMVARHPDLGLAFVGAGHCHRDDVRDGAGTPVVEPGSFLRGYVRADLEIDPDAPARHRLRGRARIERVSLEAPADAPDAPEDPRLRDEIAQAATKTRAALGEVVGYAARSIEPDSPELTNWITDRWREATRADVAILNRFATRQAIPRGPVTLETVYSVLPFDNSLALMTLRGSDLLHNVTCCGGHVSGVVEREGQVLLPSGRPVDPAAMYRVVATDYALLGGSGFTFGAADPHATLGEDWRAPLLRWLRANPTTEREPLDARLDSTPRRPAGRGRAGAH
ncbi:MAG: bifunctional metallophosphatase/5'-nucleotidase [Polyangiaceae bacterium]|nr:bifunctional metallophosphatase/5'-nucleotidase [Polyangiaceae bacterium]